jgi:hypothetical protein
VHCIACDSLAPPQDFAVFANLRQNWPSMGPQTAAASLGSEQESAPGSAGSPERAAAPGLARAPLAQPAATADAPLRHPLALPHVRDLWLGMTVSLFGDQFYLVALPWLVLQLTGPPGPGHRPHDHGGPARGAAARAATAEGRGLGVGFRSPGL